MKKITLLASACLLFAAQSLVAQEAQEVQYVEDATQGYLINSFKDNWFITLQGGANVYFSHADSSRDLLDRFHPNVNISVGKWFTPVWGGRINLEGVWLKGMGEAGSYGMLPNEHMTDGYYKTRTLEVGPTFDLMANLTNLFCGYKPGRVYNAILYAGAGGYWSLTRELDKNGNADGWHNGGDRLITARVGLINQFNVSDKWAISLDLRASALDGMKEYVADNHRTTFDVQAYLGVTYNFGKSSWNAPIVPVCPPAENCDPIRAQLKAAEARIADLESQLRDCLNRPAQVVKEAEQGPLATIYFPIGVSRLTREDNNVVTAIAEVMKADTDKKYVITGWADNYTGSDAVNNRLRDARATNVFNKLVKCGVNADQLEKTTNNGSLCGDLGEKFVSLDRATTIEEKK